MGGCVWICRGCERCQDRQVVLRFGSDDGIKVWLNGAVDSHARSRSRLSRRFDWRPVFLKAGINRIFVKIDNYTAGWGFGVAVPLE